MSSSTSVESAYYIRLPEGDSLWEWVKENGRILTADELALYVQGATELRFDQFIGWSCSAHFGPSSGWLIMSQKTLKTLYYSLGHLYMRHQTSFWFIVPTVIAMAYTDAPVF
jgi:hypothetical protein